MRLELRCDLAIRMQYSYYGNSGLVSQNVSFRRKLTKEMRAAMSSRTEVREARVFRRSRQGDVLCRLTYSVTPFHDGLVTWFLLNIEELD